MVVAMFAINTYEEISNNLPVLTHLLSLPFFRIIPRITASNINSTEVVDTAPLE